MRCASRSRRRCSIRRSTKTPALKAKKRPSFKAKKKPSFKAKRRPEKKHAAKGRRPDKKHAKRHSPAHPAVETSGTAGGGVLAFTGDDPLRLAGPGLGLLAVGEASRQTIRRRRRPGARRRS